MTAILSMLAGAGIGAIVTLVLYVLGIGVELLNCACQIVSFDCNGGNAIPIMWKSGTFVAVLLFCTIAGAVIGLTYGICKMKMASDEVARIREAAKLEEVKKQHVKFAGEVKQKALSVAITCEKNYKDYKTLISPIYNSDIQMDMIIKELANAAELKGKVDAMANDTKMKGGVSK